MERAMTDRRARIVSWIEKRGEPAFAVLDAARDVGVYATLVRGEFGHASLFDGPKGEALCDVAPYLVPLPPDSPLLAKLAGEWWGGSIGILLTSREKPESVRERLRRVLNIETEDGRSLVFRFYDPRVLRVFLPIASPGQIATFFGDGEIGAYACEGSEARGMHVFSVPAVDTLGSETVMLEEGEQRGAVGM
jgi:hypothetical protein